MPSKTVKCWKCNNIGPVKFTYSKDWRPYCWQGRCPLCHALILRGYPELKVKEMNGGKK